MFENTVLRRIFGPKRDEVTGEWRSLRFDGLNDLYCSLNIIPVIKSRMRWTGNVARMVDRSGVHTMYLWGDLRVGYHLQDLGVE